jgi:hypothetical protein
MACTEYMVVSYEDATDDDAIAVTLGGNAIAAEHAAQSTTDAIRDSLTVNNSEFDLYLVDGEALISACETHGYEVAEHSAADRRLDQQ